MTSKISCWFLTLIVLVVCQVRQAKVIKRADSVAEYDTPKEKREFLNSSCLWKLFKVGCYRDKLNEHALTLLFNDRSNIDWQNWESYLNGLVCKCANQTHTMGFTHFGIQYYGECYSGKEAADLYNKYNQSSSCINTNFSACNDESEDACSGEGYANYVYMLEPGCYHNDVFYPEGSAMPGDVDDPCTTCTCSSGQRSCRAQICEHAYGSDFCEVEPEGECCKHCACVHSGENMSNGSTWTTLNNEDCYSCTCVEDIAECLLDMTACFYPAAADLEPEIVITTERPAPTFPFDF